MKHIYAIIFLFLASLSISAQEFAIDFNQSSCYGEEHHLFDELNNGKVIILEFVMLNCAPCIVATKALDQIQKEYEITKPGKVSLYSFGFLDLYTCDQIKAWSESNGFTHPVFSHGESQVSYYGGMGMPTIVILGTADHKVYYKTIGYTSSLNTEIKAAVDLAIADNALTINEQPVEEVKIYPTIFNDYVLIEGRKADNGSTVNVYSATGVQVLTSQLTAGQNNLLNTSTLSKGLYFIEIVSKKNSATGNYLTKIIKQ